MPADAQRLQDLVSAYVGRDEFFITLAAAVNAHGRGNPGASRTPDLIVKMVVAELGATAGLAVVVADDPATPLIVRCVTGMEAPVINRHGPWEEALSHGRVVSADAAELFPGADSGGRVHVVPMISASKPVGLLVLVMPPGEGNTDDEVELARIRLLRVVASTLALVVVTDAALQNERQMLADAQAALKRYETRVATIERQNTEIRRMAAPMIRVWDGVLTVPIIGSIDSERVGMISERLLATIAGSRSSIAVLDVTGVEAADAETSHHLLHLARSIRLLGCECVISGLRAAIAREMSRSGTGFGDLRTFADMQSALAYCFTTLGMVVRTRTVD